MYNYMINIDNYSGAQSGAQDRWKTRTNLVQTESIMTNRATLAQAVLDNLSTAVMVFDSHLRLSLLNTAGESLLSISKRKVAGQKPDEILPFAPSFIEAVERALSSQHAYTEWGMELVLLDGKKIVVDCMITPHSDSDGEQSALIVELVNTHMHSRIVREENLQALHDAARESMRAVAHEVKNPLGGLRGAAQLLQSELTDESLHEYTRIIISEADRLRNLVDRMLGPNTRPQRSLLNIHEVLEYVCVLMDAEAGTQLDIQRDYDPSIPELSADREKLIQAVLNIVRNAWQAVGTDGEITLRTRPFRQFTIGQRLHKLVVRIEVIDNGPGIPPEIGAGAFYPLITGRADGTGLGLSIAQSLIQEHGGFIEYERREGKTVFAIAIPLE